MAYRAATRLVSALFEAVCSVSVEFGVEFLLPGVQRQVGEGDLVGACGKGFSAVECASDDGRVEEYVDDLWRGLRSGGRQTVRWRGLGGERGRAVRDEVRAVAGLPCLSWDLRGGPVRYGTRRLLSLPVQ